MTEHVAFTGTRRGMTAQQAHDLRQLLVLLRPVYFHHGCCVGADAQAHDIARAMGLRIVLHPPSDPKHMARCWGPIWERRAPRPYLERNHNLVDACATLIATPGEATEQLRSGTWATVRYARRANRIVHVLAPT